MKAIDLIERLKEKTIFRVADIERMAFCSNAYAKLILHRLKERKLIRQITKNTYTMKKNIFVIASNITTPSYISFWSASYFLGYTEQMISTVQVAVTRKVKKIEFEGYRIKFMPLKEFFGYKKVSTEEGDLFIAENEKLIIDCLLKWKEMGNFAEIEKIFKNSRIEKEKLIDYLKKVNNKALAKRIGWLLEKTKKMDISKNFKLDNNYILLNPFQKKWKKISTKWRVKI